MAGPAEGSLWYYAPNKGAPIAFAVLFFISGVIHVYQTHKYKSWRISILLAWACSVYIAGLVLREIGAYHYTKLNIYISSTVMLYCAPPIYAGANYFILSRSLYYVPHQSPMHPGRVASTFIGLDVVVEVLTGNGASRLANKNLTATDVKIGGDLIKASLIMQLVLMVAFASITIKFHWNCVRAKAGNASLMTVIYVLYVSTALIFARSVFRTVENFETLKSNPDATLITHEAYFWIFEASLMIINSYMLNIFHPGRYLPRSMKTYLAKDGVTEIEGPGWVDHRNFLLTLFDPFDLSGLIRGRDKETRFWEQEVEQREQVPVTETASKV